MKPEAYRLRHWQAVNAAARVIGWLFLVGGGLGVLDGAVALLNPNGSVLCNGAATKDVGIKALFVLFPLVTAVLGILLIRAEAFYPPDVKKLLSEDDGRPAGSEERAD